MHAGAFRVRNEVKIARARSDGNNTDQASMNRCEMPPRDRRETNFNGV